jgi:hypothetical protein
LQQFVRSETDCRLNIRAESRLPDPVPIDFSLDDKVRAIIPRSTRRSRFPQFVRRVRVRIVVFVKS